MIDAAEMAHLKKLARLELSGAETAQLQHDLNAVLGYFEQLRELDTDGVEELRRPVPLEAAALENVLRADVPGEMFTQQEALSLAPEQQDGFFKVPRTVEQ